LSRKARAFFGKEKRPGNAGPLLLFVEKTENLGNRGK
jgi:hypothetical protein